MTRVRCNKCGYIWKTKTKKQFVSCPDCLNKVNVERNKLEEKNAKRRKNK